MSVCICIIVCAVYVCFCISFWGYMCVLCLYIYMFACFVYAVMCKLCVVSLLLYLYFCVYVCVCVCVYVLRKYVCVCVLMCVCASHGVCLCRCLRLPRFEFSIQQRKTICLLLIRKSLACMWQSIKINNNKHVSCLQNAPSNESVSSQNIRWLCIAICTMNWNEHVQACKPMTWTAKAITWINHMIWYDNPSN